MSAGGIKTAKRILYILMAVGIILIGLYHFDVQEITLQVIASGDTKNFTISGAAARNENFEQIIYNVTNLEVEKVKIYRKFKSICLRNIDYSELASLIDAGQSSTMHFTDSSLIFQDENQVKIVLNNEGKKVLRSQASTFWLERVMLAEIWMTICILGIIVCNALEERKQNTYSNHGLAVELRRFRHDMHQYWQYMIFSARADLNAEVANSYLNRLWWLLEPLFSMLVYVIVFGGMMGRSIENYATFVFSSLLMWNYFSKTINYSVKLVRNNRDIVTKVYVPKFVLLVSNMMLNFFKLTFSLIILVPMLFIFKVSIGWNILYVIPAYVIMVLVSFGLGMILLHYGVYIDDFSYAVGILLQMMMFLSGVFYDTMSTLTYPINTLMISVNPLAMLIDTMRNALLYNTAANIPLLGIWLVISIVLCYVGIHIVYKHENAYVKVV